MDEIYEWLILNTCPWDYCYSAEEENKLDKSVFKGMTDKQMADKRFFKKNPIPFEIVEFSKFTEFIEEDVEREEVRVPLADLINSGKITLAGFGEGQGVLNFKGIDYLCLWFFDINPNLLLVRHLKDIEFDRINKNRRIEYNGKVVHIGADESVPVKKVKDSKILNTLLKKVWGRRRSCLHPIYQYWKTPTQPKYHYKYTTKTDEDGKKRCVKVRCHQIGWSYNYERITIGYKTCHYNYVKGHNLIWWSDKDIGIDYLLNKCKWE